MSKWWAALIGFSDAGALILGLALPALLCKPEDVARTAAGTFTLSYGARWSSPSRAAPPGI
jgi:hypothetical protein